jgi:hypothetical protein
MSHDRASSVVERMRAPQDRDVTSADVQLRIRPPRWARVWVAAFPFVFAGFFLFVVRPDGNLWLGGFVVFLFCPALAWRLFRLAAIGMADGTLVVRNHWHDQRLNRDDIAAVRVDRAKGSQPTRAVHVFLHDGTTVGLDVTESWGSRSLQRHEAAVRAWLFERPQPFL